MSYYRPIDELLTSPRWRLLRALRHYDWAHPYELATALDVATGDEAMLRALRRLLADGLAERRGVSTRVEYRITPAGRAELPRINALGGIDPRPAPKRRGPQPRRRAPKADGRWLYQRRRMGDRGRQARIARPKPGTFARAA